MLEDAVAEAKEALNSGDNERIKSANEKLQKDIAPVISKLYQQAQQAGGAQDSGNGDVGGDDTEFNQHT